MTDPHAPSGPLARRGAGVLLHVTSLPSGTLGREAFAFVDWLAAAGQSWWQVLPLGPPNRLRSPYEAASAFACWPGLLARPSARVSGREIRAFAERHPWAAGWERFAGPGAVADQVRFAREWGALRRHAADRGVAIMGDVPLYVAADGADVALQPELFRRGEVGGCPPDYFSDDGQRWGNPTYDWARMRGDGFAWWLGRLERTFELVDAARIDHFRGLVAHWAIPARARTARSGRWRRSPGAALLGAIGARFGSSALIAEDLGVITPAVERLRRGFGLPGMAVLHFMMDHGLAQDTAIWGDEDRVIYTGTHDNATSAQWLRIAPATMRRNAAASLAAAGIAGRPDAWGLVRLAHAAPARIAVCPAQDLLGLGAGARMNTPGRRAGNWRWRLAPGALTARLAERLREVTVASGRVPGVG